MQHDKSNGGHKICLSSIWNVILLKSPLNARRYYACYAIAECSRIQILPHKMAFRFYRSLCILGVVFLKRFIWNNTWANVYSKLRFWTPSQTIMLRKKIWRLFYIWYSLALIIIVIMSKFESVTTLTKSCTFSQLILIEAINGCSYQVKNGFSSFEWKEDQQHKKNEYN